MPEFAQIREGEEAIIYPLPLPQSKSHKKLEKVFAAEYVTDKTPGESDQCTFDGKWIRPSYDIMRFGKRVNKTRRIEVNARTHGEKKLASDSMAQIVEAMKDDTEPQISFDDSEAIATQIEEAKKTIYKLSESMPTERRNKIKIALAIIGAAELAADIIKEHAEKPDGNLYDKLGEVAARAGLTPIPHPFLSGGVSHKGLSADALWLDESRTIDPANPLQFSGGFLHIPPEKPKEWEPEPSEPIVVKLKWNKSGGFQNSLDEPDPKTCKHRNTDYFIGTGVVCRDCKKKLRV